MMKRPLRVMGKLLLAGAVLLLGLLTAGAAQDQDLSAYYEQLMLDEDECFLTRPLGETFGMKFRFTDFNGDGCTAEWEPYTERNRNFKESDHILINGELRGSAPCTIVIDGDYVRIQGLEMTVIHTMVNGRTYTETHTLAMNVYLTEPLTWLSGPRASTGDVGVSILAGDGWGQLPEGSVSWETYYQYYWKDLYDLLETARSGDWEQVAAMYPQEFKDALYTLYGYDDIPDLCRYLFEDLAASEPFEFYHEHGDAYWVVEGTEDWDSSSAYLKEHPFFYALLHEMQCRYGDADLVQVKFFGPEGWTRLVMLQFYVDLYYGQDYDIVFPFSIVQWGEEIEDEERIKMWAPSYWNDEYLDEEWHYAVSDFMRDTAEKDPDEENDYGTPAVERVSIERAGYTVADLFPKWPGLQKWAVRSASPVPEGALDAYKVMEEGGYQYDIGDSYQVDLEYIDADDQICSGSMYVFCMGHYPSEYWGILPADYEQRMAQADAAKQEPTPAPAGEDAPEEEAVPEAGVQPEAAEPAPEEPALEETSDEIRSLYWYGDFESFMTYAQRGAWESIEESILGTAFRSAIYTIAEEMDWEQAPYFTWYAFLEGCQAWTVTGVEPLPKQALEQYQKVEYLTDGWLRRGGAQIDVTYLDGEGNEQSAVFYMFELLNDENASMQTQYVILPEDYGRWLEAYDGPAAPLEVPVLGVYFSTRRQSSFPEEMAGLEDGMYVFVDDVEPSSDAYAQGLRPGDVILAVNGQQVSDYESVRAVLQTLAVGDSVSFTVYRETASFEMTASMVDKHDMVSVSALPA